MKIIFMGTPDFAVPALKALVEDGHEVIAVYAQKPKAANRGMKITKSKIHEFAESVGLKVFTPDTLKTAEEQQNFKNLSADIAVVAAYGMLLPKEILEGTKLGAINIHPSLLPRWRGAAPLQRTLMAGDSRSAVCIMKMDEGLDTGDVILKEEFEITSEADCQWLHDHCAELGAKLTLQAIEFIKNGKAIFTKQSSDGVTYAKKIKKEDEIIDFTQRGEEIINKIRGLSPFPGASFMLDGIKFKIFKARLFPSPLAGEGGRSPDEGLVNVKLSPTPHPEKVGIHLFSLLPQGEREFSAGVILNEQFHISCANGTIAPEIIQKEGKPRMAIAEFLKGNKVEIGKKVGFIKT